MPRSKKVKFIRIDGSTPAQTRGDLVNKFQQNTDVRVAILSINAAGTGLTLTVSRPCCYYNLTCSRYHCVLPERHGLQCPPFAVGVLLQCSSHRMHGGTHKWDMWCELVARLPLYIASLQALDEVSLSC